jgi:hypothetical protein
MYNKQLNDKEMWILISVHLWNGIKNVEKSNIGIVQFAVITQIGRSN